MIHYSYIALGANIASGFASNSEDLRSALVHGAHALLREAKLKSLVASSLYDTSPMGAPGRQPRYVNAVLRVETSLSAGQLLRLVKRIEVAAGRRKRGLNGPRPLDIDIIDFGGRRLGWPTRRADAQLRAGQPRAKKPRAKKNVNGVRHGSRGWMTIPHPQMHRRLFVLQPLAELAPHWHHPVLRVPIRQLLARLPRPPGQIRRTLDSGWLSCDACT